LTAFSAENSLREFETATDIRLIREPESFAVGLVRRQHPQGDLLPSVASFELSAADAVRLGGRFCVRVWHRDEPDQGVRDGGLVMSEVERGPDAGRLTVAATASRANVEVMFWADAEEIGPDEIAAWTALTAFLHRL
jgi:hypothetical protein